MAKSLSGKANRAKKKEHIREQLVEKLEQDQAEFAEQYQQIVENYENSKTQEDVKSSVTNLTAATESSKPDIHDTNKEETNMAKKDLDLGNDFENFGKDAKDETIHAEALPSIEDDAENLEEKAKSTTAGSDDDKATKGKFAGDLEEEFEKRLNGNKEKSDNIRRKAADVSALLKKNLLLKQMITNQEFGRGLTMATKNIAGKDEVADKVSSFKIENIKPGRAKAVVVSMPKCIANIITTTMQRNSKTVIDSISEIIDDAGNLKTTEAADLEMVDIVMGYDDLMVRVANVCEGTIAEFGGIDGVLDAHINSKTTQKVDRATGEVTYENADLSGAQDKTVIGGKQYLMYKMNQPNSALMAKAMSGEALGEKDLNTITRWKEGKSPLKRTRGAYSALYTPTNFTSLTKFETAKPFADGLSKEEAASLSAKAVFRKEHLDTDASRIENYDANMINGDLAKVFDPSVSAKDRYELLTVAKGYIRCHADGTPYTKKVRRVDENGKAVSDENGKPVFDSVQETSFDKTLTDRVPKDFYTGEPIKDIATIEFVKYGEPGMTKGSEKTPAHATAPRVLRKRISFEGLEAVVDPSKGTVGTFGMDDTSVSRLVELTSAEVAKDAFIKAASRKGGKGGTVEESDYEDGLLAAIMYTM